MAGEPRPGESILARVAREEGAKKAAAQDMSELYREQSNAPQLSPGQKQRIESESEAQAKAQVEIPENIKILLYKQSHADGTSAHPNLAPEEMKTLQEYNNTRVIEKSNTAH